MRITYSDIQKLFRKKQREESPSNFRDPPKPVGAVERSFSDSLERILYEAKQASEAYRNFLYSSSGKLEEATTI